MKIAHAIYPGSFDPITLGHLDIMNRSLDVIESLTVAVGINAAKEALFTLQERIDLIEDGLCCYLSSEKQQRVTVEAFDGLLVNFAKGKDCKVLIRGLRAVSDFDYEFQMAGMNARLNPNIETVFLMASETNQFVASRFVKEVASFGGDVSSFVPKNVNELITKKY